MNMEWLNYHHLFYFWNVAREGSIAQACKRLRLAQSTISSQIHSLEDNLGIKLLDRSGRGLVITDGGRLVYRYADQIFSLGQELRNSIRGEATEQPLRLVVGISDVLPKLIAYRILEPAFTLPEPIHVICHEGRTERLLADLSVHELDLVLADSPIGQSLRVQAFSHLLVRSSITCFATKSLASAYIKGFPRSLDGAPFLMPTSDTTLRRSLDQWFHTQGIRPNVVGEFEDSALLKVFGQSGMGVFAVHTAIEDDVQKQYDVLPLGRLESIEESFYAITVERELKHPAVIAVVEAARQELFTVDG